MPLWDIDYFSLSILSSGRHGRSHVEVSSYKSTFTFVRVFPFCSRPAFTVPVEGRDLNLHNNLTLVTVLFLVTSYSLLSVRVVGDVGCEKVHKEKERQRAKFYSLSKRGKGHGVEKYISS